MYKNILLIKMSSMGDIVQTLPSVYALRKNFPAARITWIVHPQFGDFIPPAYVDEVIYFDKAQFMKAGWLEKWRTFFALRKKLVACKFDLVIDMQGLLKSAIVALMTGCKNRIGFCDMREGSYWVSKPIVGPNSEGHVVQRYLDVVRSLGVEADEIHFPLPDFGAEEASLAVKMAEAQVPEHYVVVAPGGRWESKVWPVEYFAELTKRLVANGENVVLAGDKGDIEKGEQIIKIAGGSKVYNLIAKTSLKEMIVLIRKCKLLFGVDTGPMHFAAALNKPIVCMFGPSTTKRSGPYGSDNQVSIQSPVPCAGCRKKQRCDHWNCMHLITPDMVYDAYKTVVSRM